MNGNISVEKSCTDPFQARRCRAGEGCQREEHGVLWSPVMETRMWEKILQQKVVKSSSEEIESSSVSWRQHFRSNSSLWKCSKTTQTTSSWVKDELQHLGLDGRSKEEHWGTSADVLELWDGPGVSKVRVYIFLLFGNNPWRNLWSVCWALISSWIHWYILCFSMLLLCLK